jgi:hypothetical protein
VIQITSVEPKVSNQVEAPLSGIPAANCTFRARRGFHGVGTKGRVGQVFQRIPSHAVFNGDVALVAFAVGFGAFIGFTDVAELRQGDSLAGRGDETWEG